MVMFSDIVILVILLGLSGFFSGSEVALLSISKVRVRRMVENDRTSSRYIKKLKDNPQKMLATILIGNNLVNIAASSFMTAIMIDLFDSYAIGIATGIMTLLVLVFGEITPKSIAAHNTELICQIVSPFIYFLSIVLSPVVLALDKGLNLVLNAFGLKKKKKTVTEEDILMMVRTAEEEGSIKKVEKNMIGNVLRLDDTTCKDIVTPSTDLVMIEADATIAQTAEVMLEKKFSRLPVFDQHHDNIVGIVYMKDLITYYGNKDKMKVAKLMRKPFIIPETKKVSVLLRQFQKRHEQMAIVVDEHGAVEGIVTLEDVLEEIVGEIMDENELLEKCIIKIGRDSWRVSGKAEIAEVNLELGMELRNHEYDTFSGFLLWKHGQVPSLGDMIKHKDFEITIRKIDGNRVAEAVVRKAKSKEKAE
jgi:CBS domain containing-hemolysin-like protein